MGDAQEPPEIEDELLSLAVDGYNMATTIGGIFSDGKSLPKVITGQDIDQTKDPAELKKLAIGILKLQNKALKMCLRVAARELKKSKSGETSGDYMQPAKPMSAREYERMKQQIKQKRGPRNQPPKRKK